ncbi:nuclear transport factor 2 family protein [uncultured Maribacter sp.]|uniref:YybH family protein n=1 Tax=uncultured Maribacter sp. TaxID=431308 RepID=UPI00261DE3F9|nr:nuclear transport factor 2 family protein [uncultured Maribacter sp.]
MFKTKSYLLIALTFSLIWVGNAQTNKKMETNFNSQQKEVYSTIEKMVIAFESKDIDGVLSTYEKNAIVMFEPGKPITGHNELRQAFTQFVNFNPNYTFSSHEVYISGDIATHIAPWNMVGTLPDGNKIEQNGLSVAILRRQTDGSWLMIQDNPHGQFRLNN